ncbi:HAD family hydrolase [Planosporangium sp. 12N6]|uniref:HAD family hydrolase n=1 Tax=Planosporangium spinosum TaxID=3402278 RepID=UPI003CEC8C24
MTTPDDPLARNRALLLDFDGPVCAVFTGYPAATAAARLHAVIGDRLGHLPPDIAELASHPLGILRRTADLGDDELTRAVADACRDAELTAVATAAPTPGVVDVLRAARDSGCPVAIVSNNHADARRGIAAGCPLTRLLVQTCAAADRVRDPAPVYQAV